MAFLRHPGERGSPSVEHTGLLMLVALACVAALAALAAHPPGPEARELGSAIGRKLRCAPRLPDACWHDPLTEAYGRSLAGAVRALAQEPGSESGLLPVDFRRCRSASCALPGPRDGLTASNRRVTEFVSVKDRRRVGGEVVVSYWLYRPTIGWDERRVLASGAEVAALASTSLPGSANPVLVPLETLDGRNHIAFAPGEEPPWRWRVESAYP
jgi:hypothetical protein